MLVFNTLLGDPDGSEAAIVETDFGAGKMSRYKMLHDEDSWGRTKLTRFECLVIIIP